MLKVALVGVGGISGAHIPAWNNMEDAELVALCDIRPKQMERYPEQRHYTDFDEMLAKEQIDILDICLPTYLHVDFAVKAMQRGINVLCEKPISLKKDDVARAYRTAEENGVKFMIAQVLRFWPEYEVVKAIFDNRTYGALLSGSMTRLGCYPKWSWDGWMMDESRSGLVPFDLHIHDVDFLVYAFGTPNQMTSHRSRRPEQDYINAVYDYGDFFITTEASWYASPYPFQAAFRFQLEHAVVAWEQGELTIYEENGKIRNPIGADAQGDTGSIGLPASDAYANEIRYFADCVKENKAPDRVKPAELETVIELLKAL
ncbi:MAG: Gfo/Idh/MocA family oxidoreductase [Clostridia bacterium]|nr:Gfo/Idh/MocA family oxidoreductase [Clostridia bacterium]